MTGLLLSLNRRWQRKPTGYLAGATLNRLAASLPAYPCERLSPIELQLTLPQGPTIVIHEQAQSLFMAHIVSHRFVLTGQTTLAGEAVLQVQTTGWLRRRSVRFHPRRDTAAAQHILAVIARFPQIADTLGQLDFRRVLFTLIEGTWQLEIEHFAASEVVSRLPAARRYLRLEPEQRRLLLSVFLMISQLMEKGDE